MTNYLIQILQCNGISNRFVICKKNGHDGHVFQTFKFSQALLQQTAHTQNVKWKVKTKPNIIHSENS